MPGLKLPTVRDWMVTPSCILKPGDRVLDAIDRLVEHKLSAAPVCDHPGRLTGLLTEKDCLRILTSITYEHGWEMGLVADYQSPVPAVCAPEMDLLRAAELFLHDNFPVLPVEEDGELVGTLSRQAMLRGIQHLRRQLERNQSLFESEAGRQADRPRGIEKMQRAAGANTREVLARLFGR